MYEFVKDLGEGMWEVKAFGSPLTMTSVGFNEYQTIQHEGLQKDLIELTERVQQLEGRERRVYLQCF